MSKHGDLEVWPANQRNLGRTIEVILSARMFCVKSCMQRDFDLKQIDIYFFILFGDFESKFLYLWSQFVIYLLKLSTANRYTTHMTNIEPRVKLTDTDRHWVTEWQIPTDNNTKSSCYIQTCLTWWVFIGMCIDWFVILHIVCCG